MKIEEFTGKWRNPLSKRNNTNFLILHHSGSINASFDQIHNSHLNNGWAGIGYHFFVNKKGFVYEGRPLDTIGAHTEGYNSISIGICFEGDFTREKMNDLQLNAGVDIIKYCLERYPKIAIKRHKDFAATLCPGTHFPFEEIVNQKKKLNELTDINDIVWEYSHRGIISDTNLWLEKLSRDSNAYWLARKTLQYIRQNNL